MAEKRADALVEFRADDVLEFAGLRIGLGVWDRKSVSEEALGETAAADDIAGAALTAVGEGNFGIVSGDEADERETLNGALGICIERMETGKPGAFAGLLTNPEFFEDVVETRFIFRGINGDLRQSAVGEFDAAIGKRADGRVVRDHENGVAFAMQFAEEADDGLLVGLVEIAGGLVGENQLGVINQSAGEGDALLFASRKLAGKMSEALGESDAAKRLGGFGFVRGAVKILREHDVLERSEIGHEMKLLKNESNFL